MITFDLLSESSGNLGRRGRLSTPHGTVETPAFMPVGTQASVKGVSASDLHGLGFEQILSNTYHLELRPGSAPIEAFGGLHAFMGWNGSILTDSGGYQVMSLSSMRTLSDEGVRFKSHLDGRELFMSPEESIRIQGRLGVDISMCLDVCAPYPCSRAEAEAAMVQTHRWAPRNLAAAREGQAVFGIVQGGVHEDLRTISAQTLGELDFAGFAIGGVSVGEPTELQYPVVKFSAPLLPKHKPRYLMGVGHPQDILHAVECGIDLFDCVLPTRMARHNTLYTLNGRVNVTNQKWEMHRGPFDEKSVFPACEGYSAGYIRHLFKAKEPLGPRLASLHNLAFYARLMREIRAAIEQDTWGALRERYARA